MNSKYSTEFKENIIARLLPPQNASVLEVAREAGVPKDTLYSWRIQYRNLQDGPVVASGRRADKFTNEEKLAVMIETADLNELELGEYCRRKGLYPEQISDWKKSYIQWNDSDTRKAEREQSRKQSRTIKGLQRELQRKEKALAEAAALLILQKKFQALWEDPEDEKSNSGSAKI